MDRLHFFVIRVVLSEFIYSSHLGKNICFYVNFVILPEFLNSQIIITFLFFIRFLSNLLHSQKSSCLIFYILIVMFKNYKIKSQRAKTIFFMAAILNLTPTSLFLKAPPEFLSDQLHIGTKTLRIEFRTNRGCALQVSKYQVFFTPLQPTSIFINLTVNPFQVKKSFKTFQFILSK